MEATIDRFGRIVIPKRVRNDLGIEAGTTFEIELVDGSIRLKPVLEGAEAIRDRDLLVHRGKPVVDIEGAVRRDREDRIRKFFPETWR